MILRMHNAARFRFGAVLLVFFKYNQGTTTKGKHLRKVHTVFFFVAFIVTIGTDLYSDFALRSDPQLSKSAN